MQTNNFSNRPMEQIKNALDSQRRSKRTTYSDARHKLYQFYWYGLMQNTVDLKCAMIAETAAYPARLDVNFKAMRILLNQTVAI